ncbi:rhodanese-like domain-containing protein [Microbacterium album]|uniref:Sulfurtransferase n=1 Tax=Microbacterium album TaxID=2053191 RepID=A0A917IGI1_9MICO|nr:rhodanese-like domain-containing protein [Microbacterium album]GGH43401.1 sulfurtransferase [Microbacterium album]
MTVSPSAADTGDAIAWFERRLRHETDPADVAAARAAGEPTTVVDVRSRASFDQGHVPGALHLPARELPERHGELAGLPNLVVYCWGPGCNAATKAALELSRLGYAVREMIGGFEYWAREGLAVETATGRTRLPVDPLAGPVG